MMHKMDWTKAGLTAVIGSLGSVLMGEKDTVISVLGVNLPAPVAIGGVVGAASIGSELAHDYILPHIPKNERFVNLESSALAVGSAGGLTAAILTYAGAPRENWANSFALGGGSVVLGQYANNSLYGLHGESLF